MGISDPTKLGLGIFEPSQWIENILSLYVNFKFLGMYLPPNLFFRDYMYKLPVSNFYLTDNFPIIGKSDDR
jgi:hypothetical protein